MADLRLRTHALYTLIIYCADMTLKHFLLSLLQIKERYGKTPGNRKETLKLGTYSRHYTTTTSFFSRGESTPRAKFRADAISARAFKKCDGNLSHSERS